MHLKRLIFYYNHYNTLGHSTRVFSLVAALKRHFKKKMDIVVLEGGKRQPVIPLNKYAKVFTLPYSMDRRGLFLEEQAHFYTRMISHARTGDMLAQRLKTIKNAIDAHKPDVFISEYFPFGKEFWTFELPHILQYLKTRCKCKIIGSSGYLSCIDNTYQYIRDYYDMLLIHSPKEFAEDFHLYLHKSGIAQLKRVFADFSKRIKFTGFVMDSPSDDGWWRLRKAHLRGSYSHLVLVSRGGGIVNKKIILASIFSAKKLRNIYFIICCGPATSEKEFSKYRTLCKGMNNLTLKKEIPPGEFGVFLRACDLSINMAGYNTTVKLLYYGKKSILVPFETYEQKWRANIVSRYLPARIIQEKSLSAGGLSEAVNALLKGSFPPLKPVNRDWFCGAARTVSLLRC